MYLSLRHTHDVCHCTQHHNETGHNYAIELATQRVWDYTGDCYVHRLIQNRVDGKMVEFGDPNDYGDEQSGKVGEAMAKSKHEQVIQEYEMLLTSTCARLSFAITHCADLSCRYKPLSLSYSVAAAVSIVTTGWTPNGTFTIASFQWWPQNMSAAKGVSRQWRKSAQSRPGLLLVLRRTEHLWNRSTRQ
jgi:hypothetical protein